VIEVVLESSPNCPRCHTVLARAIRELCESLGVVFHEKTVDTDAVAVFERDSSSRTLDEEWVEAFGSERHRQLLRRYGAVFKYLSTAVATPNLIIRWHDGMRPREIVIRGFPADESDPRIKPFLDNISRLLLMLKRGYG